jgi:alcohol dehydrogenase class IV
MVNKFIQSKTPQIIFGCSSRKELPGIVSRWGKNVLVVTGKSSFSSNRIGSEILELLKKSNILVQVVSVVSEPSPTDIDATVAKYRDDKPDAVVAIGGGSVIDAGKAISAMIMVDGNIKDYLEGIGTKTHPGTKLPFVAMPTTSGTGSEATKNAVISHVGNDGYKKSLRHENFMPDVALIDPELAVSCPPEITAAAGMDAFTQLVESYLSVKSNPITDALAIDGITHLIRSIEKAIHHPNNLHAREDLAYAALLSGITLANAGLGVVHGFAQPLGSLFKIPHGVVCGTLMGAANTITLEKILASGEKSIALSKYARLGRLISRREDAEVSLAETFAEYVDELTEKLHIPLLSKYGVKEQHIDKIVSLTKLKEHPVKLSETELKKILYERI